MESLGTVVSADGLTGLLLLLLYASVLFVSCRWLFPRFSSICTLMAGSFLAAQALVIILALEVRPSTSPQWWLWDVNREYNLASVLASIQLALVGGVALLTAGLSRTAPAWRRLYLVAIAAIFLALAWDEYFTLHEQMRHWKRYYLALGMAVALVTIVVALRSPRRARLWHVCFLTGLATSGTGAIFVEEFPLACGNLGFLRLDGCLKLDVLEEGLELLGVWLALAAMLGGISDAAPNPKPRLKLMLYAMPALWIVPLVTFTSIPQIELQFLAKSALVEYEMGLRLHGYHIERGGDAIRIRLYASAKRGIYTDVGYSVRIVDQVSGESIVSADKQADPFPGFWMLKPGASPVYRQWMELAIPADFTHNRALWITLSLWREPDDERAQMRILTSANKQLNENQIILEEL